MDRVASNAPLTIAAMKFITGQLLKDPTHATSQSVMRWCKRVPVMTTSKADGHSWKNANPRSLAPDSSRLFRLSYQTKARGDLARANGRARYPDCAN